MTERIAGWIVPATIEQIRLDQFLAGRIPDQSRSQIQVWIRSGRILVNGRKVKTGYLPHPGDDIRLAAPEPVQAAPFPEDIALDVVYEDPDIAVINKPAGMVCHVGAGVRSGTLVNALLHRYGPIESEDAERPGIVHRLDKLTSGLLVVARNREAHRGLARQFKARQVKKEYLALVYGSPKPPSGTIDLPLGRDPRDRKKISVRARKTRTAITHYSSLKSYGRFTLLQVRIETGRTHQIRVHLSQKGHPIVGDAVYGGACCTDRPKIPAQTRLQRPFLHSHLLEFRHPRTGSLLSFSAPLPPELEGFLALLDCSSEQSR